MCQKLSKSQAEDLRNRKLSHRHIMCAMMQVTAYLNKLQFPECYFFYLRLIQMCVGQRTALDSMENS